MKYTFIQKTRNGAVVREAIEEYAEAHNAFHSSSAHIAELWLGEHLIMRK